MADVPILQHIVLHSAQVIFLKETARRGGEIQFTWDKARDDVKGMVADLIVKKIVDYVEYVTDANQAKGITFLRLTDVGRRVVSQLEDAEKRTVQIDSPAPEVKIPAA